MKITICMGPTYPVPTVKGGAVQRMWSGVVKEMARRGQEVTIFARAYPGQPEHENSDRIRFVRWGGYDQGTNVRIDLVKGLIYALGALCKVPAGDVVVTNDFWLPILLPRFRSRVGKVVASIARFPKGQFWLYHGVDRILAVSAAVAEGIKKQTPGIAGKVGYIPNCVDEAFLKAEGVKGLAPSDLPPPIQGSASRGDGIPLTRGNSGLRLRLGNDQRDRGQLTVLYVGRIHPEKGLDVLLDAWKRLSEIRIRMRIRTHVRLKIVGPYRKEQGGGGEEYLESLKRKAGGVEWGEPVFGADGLAKVYDSGDILVYPSQAELGEAMPLAPLEGMARGLPVVVSNLEVFKEYLEEGRNGWTFNHRESAGENLAAVLGSALSSDLAVMGQEARRTAERFSPAKVAEMYVQAFEDLLKG